MDGPFIVGRDVWAPVLDNSSLMINARMAGVVLGASETEIEENISCI